MAKRTLRQERDRRETPGRERRAGPLGRCQVAAAPPPPPRGLASPGGRAAAPPGWDRRGPAVSGGDSARLRAGPGRLGSGGAGGKEGPAPQPRAS